MTERQVSERQVSERQFSDDEASRIWRRAAELQSARRLPASAARAEDGDGGHGLTSHEILAIAGEAGIDAAFVEQALTEAALTPAALDEGAVFRVVKEVEGSLAELQAAVQEVATGQPFGLRLVDIRTSGETRALIFDIPSSMGGALQAGGIAAAANIVRLHALLRPGSRPGLTEMVLHGEDNEALPRYVRGHDIGFAVGGGAGGGLAAVGAGIALAAPVAAIVAAGAAGAVALGGAGVWVMRRAQRWARRKDLQTLGQLADEITGAVRIRRLSGGD